MSREKKYDSVKCFTYEKIKRWPKGRQEW